MDPNNFQPVSNITAEELPDGFQLVNPAAGTTSNDPASSSSSQQEQKMAILEQAMTSEALARLNRIRMVNSKKATQVENVVVQMAMSGKLPGPINEGKLIELLERAGRQTQQSSSTSISIQRKKYAMDSDDEGDDDLF